MRQTDMFLFVVLKLKEKLKQQTHVEIQTAVEGLEMYSRVNSTCRKKIEITFFWFTFMGNQQVHITLNTMLARMQP